MGSHLLFVLFSLYPAIVLGRSYYTAAVFEHRPRGTTYTADQSKEIIDANLAYYEKAATVAADKGADIIVFNEYGLFPYNKNRKILKSFMENVPDPEKEKFNPCVEEAWDFHILYALSCMAMNNNIYVVANMGDVKPCEGSCDAQGIKECDEKCPYDGVRMYNTDVVFDRKGNLVARYHKQNLYCEDLNIPEDPEYITFKTDFGTFGLIVCFDSVFKDSMILAKDYAIDTLLFPTFWFDDVVPLNSPEWQQGWAIANNVNFIAANTQTPGNGSMGSGIFSKDYGALAYTYEPDGESKLLVANVPVGKTKLSDFSLKSSLTVIRENTIYLKHETGDAFPEESYIKVAGPIKDHYLDYRTYKTQTENYTLVKLQTPSGRVEACNNRFCCNLAYTASSMEEEYYLAAFSGLNNVRNFYHWYEEVCLLVRCDPFNNKKCMTQPSRSNTVFKSLSITAEFTAERIYPTVTKNKFRLAPKQEWEFKMNGSKGSLKFKSHSDDPLIKAGLLGRCYKSDPPYEPLFKY